MEKRLNGISKFLSYHGRLIPVNSVFSSLPTFFMCSLIIPPSFTKQIDRYRKHCLWNGGDINRRGTYLGYLGASMQIKRRRGPWNPKLENHNIALLLKFLDNFYNNSDIPWVQPTWSKLYSNSDTPPHARHPIGSFWWKGILKLFGKFKRVASCNPNLGSLVLLWKDNWSGDILEIKYP